jgi:hypothetical protein
MNSLVVPVTRRRLRVAGWMLVLSPLVFALWVAAIASAMSGTGVDTSADLTPAQMSTIRVGWLLAWPLYAIAVSVGAAGVALANRASTGARWLVVASQVASGLSVAAILVDLVLNESMVNFTGARLGDSGAYGPALAMSYLAIWSAVVAVALCGLALRTRAGVVVAVVGGLLVLVDMATRMFPPFVVAILWLVIGVGVLRRRVPSSE